MSFGSLSGPAVEALNRGSQIAGCLQSTGEGGVSSHHLKGGELVWQVGTAYFGCRDADGRFSMSKLKDTIARAPQIRAIEVKLSQGAKPGVGGLLPRATITSEIADIGGIPMRGVDPTSKAARLGNYIITLRKEVLALSRACGVPHPALITADDLELLDDRFGARTVAELFGYGRGFGVPSPTDCEEVRRMMKA